ncbi:hypothetical protein CVT25_000414 [Psilocybe cyanescens]|uniref:Uncharacterized protein n=1 Tax=Psilocybe cyanescens TaxID=93625 RepID=A0A409WZN9_PSICY|nr:hypothetical protein CVT25_000414 [Psilocybe cyanescens]
MGIPILVDVDVDDVDDVDDVGVGVGAR